jgi:hypothetical protein
MATSPMKLVTSPKTAVVRTMIIYITATNPRAIENILFQRAVIIFSLLYVEIFDY